MLSKAETSSGKPIRELPFFPAGIQYQYLHSYKQIGRTIVDKDATPDTAEFFNISKDVMLSNARAPAVRYPEVLTANQPLFARYITAAHAIGQRLEEGPGVQDDGGEAVGVEVGAGQRHSAGDGRAEV